MSGMLEFLNVSFVFLNVIIKKSCIAVHLSVRKFEVVSSSSLQYIFFNTNKGACKSHDGARLLSPLEARNTREDASALAASSLID